MDKIVKIFKALSDNNRLLIVRLLLDKKLCVCEIRHVLQLANSTVSKHLSILKEAGIISDEKNGKWVDYYINPSAALEIKQLLALLPMWFEYNNGKNALDLSLKILDRKEICC